MTTWRDSLYLRLVLILLISLGASFGTMYLLFQYHLERAGRDNFARIISAQIRLVEEVLETRGIADLTGLGEYRVANEPMVTSPSGRFDGPPPSLLNHLTRALSRDLGRTVHVYATTRPAHGLWVDLRPHGKPVAWLFLPGPRHHGPPGPPLSLSMLVGFLVFFAGGMFLIWRLQQPLKSLSRALQHVGHSGTHPESARLPRAGGGIVSTLSQRYNEMVERLDQHEQDRSIMLAGVAHDLRTPITRMRLLTELAEMDRREDFVRNLDTVEKIINQFLAYALGSEGEQVEPRDLNAFVEEVVDPYIGRGLILEPAQQSRSISIRASALNRALVNLIENAFEYGAPPVVFRVEIDDEQAVLSVFDSGKGLTDVQLKYSMRPFARLDQARGGKGHCGLGLVISTKIVEEHGGRLTLRSGRSGGLVAEVVIPFSGQSFSND